MAFFYLIKLVASSKRVPKRYHVRVWKGVFGCIRENKKCENCLKSQSSHSIKWLRRVRDSNPGRTCILNGFQDRRIQPLCQLSVISNFRTNLSGKYNHTCCFYKLILAILELIFIGFLGWN